jgi:hypothetical protein
VTGQPGDHRVIISYMVNELGIARKVTITIAEAFATRPGSRP